MNNFKRYSALCMLVSTCFGFSGYTNKLPSKLQKTLAEVGTPQHFRKDIQSMVDEIHQDNFLQKRAIERYNELDTLGKKREKYWKNQNRNITFSKDLDTEFSPYSKKEYDRQYKHNYANDVTYTKNQRNLTSSEVDEMIPEIKDLHSKSRDERSKIAFKKDFKDLKKQQKNFNK